MKRGKKLVKRLSAEEYLRKEKDDTKMSETTEDTDMDIEESCK